MTGTQVYWITTPSFSYHAPSTSFSPSYLPSWFLISERKTECIPTFSETTCLYLMHYGDHSVSMLIFHKFGPGQCHAWTEYGHFRVTHRVTTSTLYIHQPKLWNDCPFQLCKCTNSESAGDITGKNWAALPRLHEDGYREFLGHNTWLKLLLFAPHFLFTCTKFTFGWFLSYINQAM